MHGAGLKRVNQKIAQRTTLDLWTLPGTRHPAGMIVKNGPIGIGKAKVIEIRSMVGPERFPQASGFQRRQSRVFMEVQCAALDPRIAALVTLVYSHLRAALL
jgi:hypothetical protein